jgi:hypothetical protein
MTQVHGTTIKSYISSGMRRRKEINMANRCDNVITVVGLQEPPETFVEKLSKIMFEIDLDSLDPSVWGGESEDPKGCYKSLSEQFRSGFGAEYCLLFVDEPYEKFGITVPSFYVGTKWHPAGEELTRASEAFPDLTFHISWDVEGSVGEAVIKNGMVKEKFKWEALDESPFDGTRRVMVDLLPAYLPYTLPERNV